MGNIEKYNYGVGLGSFYDFTKKQSVADDHIRYMLARCQSMFEYDGLPDTIPKRMLELLLQVNGYVCITKVNGDLYAFYGSLGGVPDAYYMPTECIVNNPYLKFNKKLLIDQDCIIITSDSMYAGLLPMFNRYSSALVENEISMNINSIYSRITALISAGDDRTKASAEKFLKDIADGKMGVIGENTFLEGVKCQDYGTNANNTITNLIEYEQYLKAGWYNDLGLNANYNMKRESINSGESQLNNDMLLPLVDDMLHCRELGVEKVNEMFGTNITVRLASSWEDIQEELDEEEAPEEPTNEPEGEPEKEEEKDADSNTDNSGLEE